MIGTKAVSARITALDTNEVGKVTTVRVRKLDTRTGRMVGSEEKAYMGPGLHGFFEKPEIKIGADVLVTYRIAPIVMGFVSDDEDHT